MLQGILTSQLAVVCTNSEELECANDDDIGPGITGSLCGAWI